LRPNTVSPTWFGVFLDRIPESQTLSEVEFVARNLPRPLFTCILDVACGSGRIAIPLAERGYDITGVDTDAAAIEQARRRAPTSAQFRQLDMRQLDVVEGEFDGVLVMWHSFGYETDDGNRAQLSLIASRAKRGGRVIMDVYNRDALARFPAHETSERGGVMIESRRVWNGNRLAVSLRYSNGETDAFEWRLYTPVEFAQLAEACGLRVLTACAWNDERVPPSGEHARMQFVMERM
jgi:SAM-dependent methyltransferase